MENRFLLATDVAKLLNCSSQNVRKLEQSGKLRADKTPAGVRIFGSADVRRLAAERKRDKRN
jgi:DNA-binding transcriptional MerR regulator